MSAMNAATAILRPCDSLDAAMDGYSPERSGSDVLMQSAGLLIICHMRRGNDERADEYRPRWIRRGSLHRQNRPDSFDCKSTLNESVKSAACAMGNRARPAILSPLFDARWPDDWFPELVALHPNGILHDGRHGPTFYILDAYFDLIFQVFHAIQDQRERSTRSRWPGRPASRRRPSSGSFATCSTCEGPQARLPGRGLRRTRPCLPLRAIYANTRPTARRCPTTWCRRSR